MAAPKKKTKPSRPAPAPKPPAKPPVPPVPVNRYFVRCTYLGDDKKVPLEGAFRFILEAPDTTKLASKLEQAVKRLRRSGELPRRCDVYVEFVLELADLPRGLVVDFERWQREPRKFQHGCIAVSESCRVHEVGFTGLSFHFGRPAAAAPVPAAPA
jgi:hypothetical protein